MPQPEMWDLLFKRDDPAVHEVRAVADAPLRAGEVRLAVERFALTSNNVTYARLGDSPLRFWAAFPAPPGYGRVPVWGFARVVRSRHPSIGEGSRCFGYLPMSTHLTVAAEPTTRGFADTSAHRLGMHPWYRHYRIAGEPEEADDHRALLRPVYPASFQLAELALRQAAAGARSVVITSASSKTAIGLADRLLGSGIATIGLTSARNESFVRGLGRYHAVAEYRALDSLIVAGPILVVDFTRDTTLLSSIYRRFAGELTDTALVGLTRGARGFEAPDPPELHDPEPTRFFAPAAEERAVAAEGEVGYYARYDRAEDDFVTAASAWLGVRRGSGPEPVVEAFLALLSGRQRPEVGHVLSP
ncbi:DUF2855 family protein [Saccharothrix luteola]|uniref:DUF2855 family protein n=1 Tax=Saccharothrix luteola TaxID=2893018 RepID=UPI001E3754A3|nr:DUF2855 family protein [Saccharothrix luteola]MCC8243204.1 DUF2855 family protein [Saccharothrix luteola]